MDGTGYYCTLHAKSRVSCSLTHHGCWTLVCEADLHRGGRGVDSLVAIIVSGLSEYFSYDGGSDDDEQPGEGRHN